MSDSLPVLTIDKAAIAWNTRHFANLTGGRLMAVLKANAFGHGEVTSTVLAAGATWLGAATLDEAISLRRKAPDAPILSWLNAVHSDYEAALTAGIDLGVPSDHHLQAISAAASRLHLTARVHLHIDVGINRDGAPRERWSALCTLASLLERAGSIRVVGIMGHLSSAGSPSAPENQVERLVFANAVRVATRRGLHPDVLHLEATAATLTQSSETGRMSRVGAGLFGIDPSHTTQLRPAMTLTAPVVSLKNVRAGEGVGYSHSFVTDRPTTLALLPIGYGDGIPRAASGRAQVALGGRKRPLVGLISMDQIVIDVGDDPVHPGDVATVFGPGWRGEPTVADWAGWANTIEHEIVTGIGTRVVRRSVADALVPAGAGA